MITSFMNLWCYHIKHTKQINLKQMNKLVANTLIMLLKLLKQIAHKCQVCMGAG